MNWMKNMFGNPLSDSETKGLTAAHKESKVPLKRENKEVIHPMTYNRMEELVNEHREENKMTEETNVIRLGERLTQIAKRLNSDRVTWECDVCQLQTIGDDTIKLSRIPDGLQGEYEIYFKVDYGRLTVSISHDKCLTGRRSHGKALFTMLGKGSTPTVCMNFLETLISNHVVFKQSTHGILVERGFKRGWDFYQNPQKNIIIQTKQYDDCSIWRLVDGVIEASHLIDPGLSGLYGMKGKTDEEYLEFVKDIPDTHGWTKVESVALAWPEAMIKTKLMEKIKDDKIVREKIEFVLAQQELYNKTAEELKGIPTIPIKNFDTYKNFCVIMGLHTTHMLDEAIVNNYLAVKGLKEELK